MSKETIIYEFEKDSEFYFEIMDLWKVSFELALGWTFFLDNRNTEEPIFQKSEVTTWQTAQIFQDLGWIHHSLFFRQ